MFKQKVTKAEFDAFTGDDAWKQKAYKEDGKGGYVLDAEPSGDIAALERAKQFANDERDQAKAALETANAKVTSLQTEFDNFKASNTGKPADKNAADIEADYKQRLADAKTAADAALQEANNRTIEFAKQNYANLLAGEIAIDEGAAEWLASEASRRLDVELVGSDVKVYITKDGKRSALTRDELKQEMVDSPKFKSVIKASDASGGGAGSNGGPGSGRALQKPLKDMGDAERAQFLKDNPTGFHEAVAAQQAAERGYA